MKTCYLWKDFIIPKNELKKEIILIENSAELESLVGRLSDLNDVLESDKPKNTKICLLIEILRDMDFYIIDESIVREIVQ